MNNKTQRKENILLVFLKKFIRIQDVIKWCIISLLGFILGMTSLSLNKYIIPFFVFIITTFCIMAFTFAINNLYDADSDRENPRRKNINAIASGRLSRKTAKFLLIILTLISLMISILFRLEIFIFCAYLLFLGWAYSAPPLRTKNIPIVDVFWHFLGFFSYIIWGAFIAGSMSLITWLIAVSIGIFGSIGQVSNHIIDYSYDKETSTVTFAVWAGLDKAKITLNFLTLLHLIVLIILVLFFAIQYYISIAFVIIIAILGLILLRPRKDLFPSKRCWTFYFAIVLGGDVYISVLISHIFILLNIKSLEFLSFSFI